MNGIEQRQRHLVVATAEKRIDDLETCLLALAKEVVTDRVAFDAYIAKERAREAERGLETAKTHQGLFDRLGAWDAMTFRQRLRWLVRGV